MKEKNWVSLADFEKQIILGIGRHVFLELEGKTDAMV